MERRRQEEAARAARLRESEERRQMLAAAAAAATVTSSDEASSSDKENAHHILERAQVRLCHVRIFNNSISGSESCWARSSNVPRSRCYSVVRISLQVLQDERDPEVRRMNEWILQAKCHAIRDQQMAEKERRL